MKAGLRKKQEGAVAVMVAFFMLLLLFIGALAIDIGNLIVARNETQNSADAAALAGAGCLYRRPECGNQAAITEPTWDVASSTAATFLPSNKVQAAPIQVAQISTGYWNVTGTPSGLELLPMTPGPNDYPAVQVTIIKDGSNANGSVPAYLAGVFGMTLKTSATATAILASPGTVGPGGLFPMALSQCMYQYYWNSATNSPDLAPNDGTVTGIPYSPQVKNEPYKFLISSSYHAGPCDTGQWTSWNTNTNLNGNGNGGGQVGASTLNSWITNGSPESVSIEDQVFVQTGTVDSLFKDTMDCLKAGGCQWETVPVVGSLTPQGQNQTVVAFACLHLLAAQNGNNPYILAQMSNDPGMCDTANSGGVGPNYGANTPPRLAQ